MNSISAMHLKSLFTVFLFIMIQCSESYSNSCKDLFSESAKYKPAEASPQVSIAHLIKVKMDSTHGLRAQALGTANNLLLRTGGKIYIVEMNGARGPLARELNALSGLEDTISSIARIDNEIWVTKRSVFVGQEGAKYPVAVQGLLESQILVSKDNGANFRALTLSQFQRLVSSPFGKFPEYATITRIENIQIAGKNALVVNAGLGPNAWISFDNAQTWRSMVKGENKWETVGYEGYFGFSNERMFFGGEHPMDSAYLKYGIFDSAGVISKLIQPKIPDLENRRVQFVKSSPYDSSLIFAGVEGGLLVSFDSGNSWTYSFKETEKVAPNRERRKYPYIFNVVFPNKENPNFVIAGGQGQVGLGTLLMSHDAGKSWIDISESTVKNQALLGLDILDDGTIIFSTRDETNIDTMEAGSEAQVSVLKFDAH